MKVTIVATCEFDEEDMLDIDNACDIIQDNLRVMESELKVEAKNFKLKCDVDYEDD